jgi:hypothetical protein
MTAIIAPPYYQVEPEEIDRIWNDIKPEIERALATSNGEATAEDTRQGLVRGTTKLILFPSETAAFGVVWQMLAFPKYKIARVLLAFGKNMRDVSVAIETAEQWGKAQGAKYVEAWVATDSRVRLFKRFGYDKTYTIIRKEL